MSIIEKIFRAIVCKWWSITVPFRLRLRGVTVYDAVFYGMPIVSLAPNSTLIIKDRAVIVSDSRFTALGVARPTIFRTLNAGAQIVIEEDVGISGGTICAAESVRIGKESLLGADVIITDTDFHSLSPHGRRYNTSQETISRAPVEIGENVFIGARSIVLKGVFVGEDSVIGAGSVVTKSINPGTVVAGNPATAHRQLKGYAGQ